MRCELCHGEGWIWRDSLPATGVMPGDPEVWLKTLKVPCPRCGGCGIASCCDGMVEDDNAQTGALRSGASNVRPADPDHPGELLAGDPESVSLPDG